MEKARDIFYRGRSDLKTLEAARAAGFDGNHLNSDEVTELAIIEDVIMGEFGLGTKAERNFMHYIKNHPELIEDVL